MSGSPMVTEADKERFLEALRTTANVSASAIEAKIARSTVYALRDEDPAFAEAWAKAVDRGTDALEDEAVRRASEGWLEPVYYQGTKVGDVRKFSDALLTLMLKSRRPERFKDRSETALTGKDGGPIEVNDARDRISSRLARLAPPAPEG